jgi:hypothetical protein
MVGCQGTWSPGVVSEQGGGGWTSMDGDVGSWLVMHLSGLAHSQVTQTEAIYVHNHDSVRTLGGQQWLQVLLPWYETLATA